MARAFITGTMVAANGMLSMIALANAENHNITHTITMTCPPLARLIRSASRSRICVCSTDVTSVSTAAIIPIDATVMPVCACVTSRNTSIRKIIVLIMNPSLLLMAEEGSGMAEESAICEPSFSFFAKQR